MCHFRKLLCVAAIAAILIPSASLCAQDFTLAPVVIEALLPIELAAPAAGTTVLDAAYIEALGAASLAELLTGLPGVQVSPTGTRGGQATISLRGSTSNQVLVLVDGVPVTDPATGITDFSRLNIPPEAIATISIQRGGLSAQYGSEAVGGVIHILTKAGATQPSWHVSVTNLSYAPSSITIGQGLGAVRIPWVPLALVDGQNMVVSFSNEWITLWADLEQAFNGFPYYDANGERRRRANANLLSASGGANMRVPLASGQMGASFRSSWRSLGVPGSLDIPTPEAHQEDWYFDARAKYQTDALAGGNLEVSLTPYAQLAHLAYADTADIASDEHQTLRTGVEGRFSWLASAAAEARGGFSLRSTTLKSTLVQLEDGSAPRRLEASIYLEPSFKVGSMQLVPAVRLDASSDSGTGLSAGLGVLQGLNLHTMLTASLSTAYRAPSFDDLYWPAMGGAEGNPHLKPETALCADVALKSSAQEGSWSAGLFARYSRDVILWQPGADGIWRPTNFGVAFYPGLEAEFAGIAGPWQFQGGYTLLYSFVLSGSLTLKDDRRIPYVPVHAGSLRAARSLGNCRIQISSSYQGLRYTTIDNRNYLPGTLIIDLDLRWKLSERAELRILASNLLNERRETVRGYPQPGFSLATTLTIKSSGTAGK
ncbi:MAG: TonB-dependent receptor [Rectinemataceae bacterium]